MSTQEAEQEADGTAFDAIIPTDALAVAMDALAATGDEAVLHAGDDAIDGVAVDAAGVMMCHVTINDTAFSSFDGGDVDVGVRLPSFTDAALAGDVTEIAFDVESRTITVDSGPVSARLSPLDPTTVEKKNLNDDLFDAADASWTMPYDTFNDAVTHAARFGGDVVAIHASEAFHGIRKTGDVDDIDVEFEDAEWVDEPSGDGHYVLQAEGYLKEIRGAVPSDAAVTMYTDNEFPTVTHYDYEGVDVTFVQAPRVEK